MHIHFNKCSNWWLKCGLFVFLMIGVLTPVIGQTDSIPADSIMEAINEMPEELMDEEEESVGFYKAIKTKFIEGKAGFMSIVALALVLGLAFCIERIIYLCLAEIDTDSFMKDLDNLISKGDIEGAKSLCRNTRGPVASVCYQGLERIHDTMCDIERSVFHIVLFELLTSRSFCKIIILRFCIPLVVNAPDKTFLQNNRDYTVRTRYTFLRPAPGDS